MWMWITPTERTRALILMMRVLLPMWLIFSAVLAAWSISLEHYWVLFVHGLGAGVLITLTYTVWSDYKIGKRNHLLCLYCGGSEFLRGPAGGESINVVCANAKCRHWFNATPKLNLFEDLNRIEPESEFAQKSGKRK